MRRAILFATAVGISTILALANDGQDRQSPPETAPQPPVVADQPPVRPGGKRQGFGGPGRAKELQRSGTNNPKRGGEGPADSGAILRPEEVDAFLAFCHQHFPPLYEKLARARESDPRAFRQMLRQVGPPMTRLMRLLRENPDEADRVIRIQKIEMDLREQRQRYRAAENDQERAAAREKIRDLLQERFDLRLARLKGDVDSLRHRLDEQTRRLAEQEQNKPQIVEEEFARFFEQPEGLGRGPWSRRPAGPASRPAVDQVSDTHQ